MAWYLLQTKARQERRALLHLQQQHYSCYLPEVRQERLQGTQRVVVMNPLFPGYLFIELEHVGQSWAPIRSTRGVLRLVGFGTAVPLALPDGWVEALRLRLLLQRGDGAEPILKAGDKVLLTAGAFAGMEAVFDCYDGQQRAIILLRCMETLQRVGVPLDSLSKD